MQRADLSNNPLHRPICLMPRHQVGSSSGNVHYTTNTQYSNIYNNQPSSSSSSSTNFIATQILQKLQGRWHDMWRHKTHSSNQAFSFEQLQDELPPLKFKYIVEIDEVFTKLRKIKLNKLWHFMCLLFSHPLCSWICMCSLASLSHQKIISRYWVCSKVFVFPALSYNQASGLDHVDSRRDVITQKIFQEIKDPKHPLHYLLPPVKLSNSQMVLWPTYPYQLPLHKSSHYGRDFIPYSISKKF